MSKYPAQPIHLTLTPEEFQNAELAAYRISFLGGRQATLFNVHLQSLGLSQEDRELYRNLTDLQRENLGAIKEQLISKLAFANVERARQTQALLRLIRHYGGPNVLICGDFNDVATCYALRTLEDAGFSSAYAQLGFGPMITYNSGRFYFLHRPCALPGCLYPSRHQKRQPASLRPLSPHRHLCIRELRG